MKYKVMQQVAMLNGIGGPSQALKRLLLSDELSDFDMKVLEQSVKTKGNIIKVLNQYVKELKAEKPDLVHVRGVQTDALMCLIACKIAGIKNTVMSINGMTSDLRRIDRFKKLIFQFIIEPMCFLLTKKAFAVYEGGLKRRKINRYKNKLCGYVYNPMPNWDLSAKDEIRNSIRKKYSISNDSLLVLSASRLSYEKGYSYVIEALKSMELKWPSKLKLMIVGDGEYYDVLTKELDSLIKNGRVLVLPGTNDVRPYYFASDVFFTASLHENHSNAILEACAVKIPTIATDVGGNPESVQNKIGGWIIPAGDAQEIECVFNKICLLTFDELKKMGEQAYKNGMANFNQHIVYKKLSEIYLEVIRAI